jgi:hypothetical protein
VKTFLREGSCNGTVATSSTGVSKREPAEDADEGLLETDVVKEGRAPNWSLVEVRGKVGIVGGIVEARLVECEVVEEMKDASERSLSPFCDVLLLLRERAETKRRMVESGEQTTGAA